MKFSNGHIFKHIKGCASPPHTSFYTLGSKIWAIPPLALTALRRNYKKKSNFP